MIPQKRVIEAQISYQKKGMAKASPPRPATITVTPGKIEVVSKDNKLTIRMKIEELHKFKRPQGKSATWATIDFVQSVEAKFVFVNIQVDLHKMDELVETLNFAWESKSNAPRRSALFADDADTLVPVHLPAPNAKPQPPGPVTRKFVNKIEVDPEGSASHPSFDNSFKPVPTMKAKQKANDLQDLFADMQNDKAIDERKAEPVHKKPPSNKLPTSLSSTSSLVDPRHIAGRVGGSIYSKQDSKPKLSYAEEAARRNKTYAPVDSRKPSEIKEGIHGASFYGNKSVTLPGNKPPTAIRRNPTGGLTTRDSIDLSARSHNVKMTPGIREAAHSVIDDCIINDDDDNDLPSRSLPYSAKSLTSEKSASDFDKFVKKQPSNNKLASFGFGSANKAPPPPYTNSYQGSAMRSNNMMDTNSNGGYSITVPKPWIYKAQDNIGNSCYMNATMQILAACPIFVHNLEIAFASLKKTNSESFHYFISLMRWLSGTHSLTHQPTTALLWKMRTCIKGMDAIFEENGGTAQQDAEECLTAVLGTISDECTGQGFRKRDSLTRRSLGGGHSPVKAVIKSTPEGDSSPPESPVGEIERKKKKKKMPADCDPVDLMEVMMRDVKRCNACGHTNHKDAVEHRVHIGVEEEKGAKSQWPNPWTVKCVQQLLAAEVAQKETIGDFKCEKCGVKCEATGTKQFVGFKEYIIIVLKRFGYDENQRLRKLDTPIRVPLYIEAADLIGDRKEALEKLLNKTIVLYESPKKVDSKKVETRSPVSKVMSTTNSWLGEEEEIKTEVTQADNTILSVVGKEEESGVDHLDELVGDLSEQIDEREWEKEKEEPMEEDEETEKAEKTLTAGSKEDVTHVIQIGSSQSDDEEVVNTSAAAAASVVQRTPPPGKIRMVTPSTVVEEAKRRSAYGTKLTDTPPPRKRGRQPQRASTGSEREREKEKDRRLSKGSSRSSLVHSEPSKRYRVDRIQSSPVSRKDAWKMSMRDIYMDDDNDETKRRLSMEKKTPCWKAEAKKEKEKEEKASFDAYDFDEDVSQSTEIATTTGIGKKKGAKKFAAPVRSEKRPLSRQNGPSEDSPTKESDRTKRQKSENIAPTTPKSNMEQRGGGRKKKEEEESASEEETEKKEVNENEDEDEKKEEDVDKCLNEISKAESCVTRRSKAREARRTMQLKKQREDEEEDEEKDGGEEEMEEDKKEEEEDRGQEGTFTEKIEEDSSTDEVVKETPPEEEMEDVEVKEKEEGVKGEEKEQEKEEVKEKEEEEVKDKEEEKVKEEEDEEGQDELEMSEGEARSKKMETERVKGVASLHSFNIPDEAAVFDTPDKHEESPPPEDGLFCDSPPKYHDQSHLNTSNRFNELMETVTVDDEDGQVMSEDGEVRHTVTPNVSPIVSSEDGSGVTSDENVELILEDKDDAEEADEEVALWRKEKEMKAANLRLLGKDMRRQRWRDLFTDTDPPPPRDHIMFRPVDDRWMKGQCTLLNLNYKVGTWNADPKTFHKLRAQSNLCKIDSAPHNDDVVYIEGDGNCFFRAISWWVTGTQEQHVELRHEIVDFMCHFPKEFGLRITGAKGKKLYTREENEMLNTGEWGTQCELYGAATLLGVDIYTYHEGAWKWYRPLFEWSCADGYIVNRMTEVGERTRFGIYLANPDNMHFEVVTYMEPVVPVSETSYRLLGTILHKGLTANSGHYVADVYDQEKQQWLHCDDANITKRSVIQVLETALDEGYVLVYGRNDSVMSKAKAK